MTGYDETAGAEALKFLEAIREEDAAVIWEMLDMQGKGYFLGLWSYVLPNISLTTIMSLAGESGFINDTMGSIIRELKNNISGFLDSPRTGAILFDDDLHARVALREISTDDVKEGVFDYIPLVMELVSVNKAAEGVQTGIAGSNLTCWKIDTLKFLRFQSGVQ